MSKSDIGSGIRARGKRAAQSVFIAGGTATAGGYFALDRFHEMILEWNVPPATAGFAVFVAGLLLGGGSIKAWNFIRSIFFGDTRHEDKLRRASSGY